MEELVAGDEAVLGAVTLVVNNLRTHIETLHDLQEALHHAVSAESAGEVGRWVVTSTDRQEVRQDKEREATCLHCLSYSASSRVTALSHRTASRPPPTFLS